MTDNGNQVKEIFDKEEGEDFPASGNLLSHVGLVPWMAGAGESVPSWWSMARDAELRRFYKNSDHLAGTVYTLRDMLRAIPFQVLPRDTTVKSHRRQALQFQELLEERFESRGNITGSGWDIGYGSLIEDYHTQDNGGFVAVEGPGKPDGPLTGMPTKLIHLDSFRCQRTGIREFPVVFTDLDGKRHKLHFTRVVAMASMSSPIAEMYGVGFCAVSRCIHVTQSLVDNSRYKEEKMGSRPKRALMVLEGGNPKSAQAVSNAMMLGSEKMDNLGLSRFSEIPFISLPTGQTISLFDLASLPDGFNSVEDTQLGMSVLALAFGVDVRQLAFALGITGQTRADAEVQHLKMRGKGPGAIIQEVTRQFEQKVLPAHLKLVFDFQDDTQDEQVADIRNKRSERHERDVNGGIVSIRVVREQMVEDGDLEPEQFFQLELEDSRTEDGLPLEVLFQSRDDTIQSLLGGIVPESEEIEVDEQIKLVQAEMLVMPNANMKKKAQMVLALLESLQPEEEEEIKPVEDEVIEEEELELENEEIEEEEIPEEDESEEDE